MGNEEKTNGLFETKEESFLPNVITLWAAGVILVGLGTVPMIFVVLFVIFWVLFK